MNTFFLYCIGFFVAVIGYADNPSSSLMDLDMMCADFVIETKQIHIPGYPHCFNPSMMKYEDGFLFSFRIRDPIIHTTNKMGLVFLDKNCDVVSKTYVVNTSEAAGALFSQEQDPRLVQVAEKIYFVFNNVMSKRKESVELKDVVYEIRRMIIAELCFEGNEFVLKNSQWLLDFESEHETKTEKNWVPFCYNQELLLSYTLYPHRVFKPLNGTNQCQTVALSKSLALWNWGGLRGGTPAIEVDGRYLAFFHTCKDLITTQSDGIRMVHYFMGAYTFSCKPPFDILSMSPQPIVAEDFYRSPAYKTWKPLKVVFPGGICADKDFIFVAFGKQDHEAWIVKMDKDKLLKSLVVVPQS